MTRFEVLDGMGVKGLRFDSDGWATIGREEWEHRFLIEDEPYGASDLSCQRELPEGVDSAIGWTEREEDGCVIIINGLRGGSSTLGFRLGRVPVPEGCQIMVVDWASNEDEQFIREVIAEWQRSAGMSADVVIVDEFRRWFETAHPDRLDMVDDYFRELVLSRFDGLNVFDDRRGFQEEDGAPSSPAAVPAVGAPALRQSPSWTDVAFTEEVEDILDEDFWQGRVDMVRHAVWSAGKKGESRVVFGLDELLPRGLWMRLLSTSLLGWWECDRTQCLELLDGCEYVVLTLDEEWVAPEEEGPWIHVYAGLDGEESLVGAGGRRQFFEGWQEEALKWLIAQLGITPKKLRATLKQLMPEE